ncbi:ferric reductase-like transmembrane domain-containing protein [Frondihabitans sp. Leaf304]|uniref:ferric reductase-like transmembrane domain-containing protein n=1 Tax=Frondihabitans sp. Leaf304 TaxID=1736329 RepID=UPI000701F039|nr:ferric reductase-like transmembrane domain-containing protein [Frondihabitans sp. Leaf304]KQQ28707.1 iron reductase [Frondihabitans sp. Leaf304]
MEDALWALGRGTGVASLVLFTVSVLLGVVTRSGRPLPGLPRFAVTLVHRNVSLAATLLLVVHIVSLLFDPYAQLTLLDTIVPFFGEYRPVWQGLGTLAFDLVFVIVATGLLRHRIGNRVFRAVHWSTYALWPIALAHAIGNGTNGTDGWFLALAGVSVALVAAAVAWRLTTRFIEFRGVRVASPVRSGGIS